MKTPLSRNPWFVLAAFMAVSVLLIEGRSWGTDGLILAAGWIVLLAMSAAAVVKMFRYGYRGPYAQDGAMPKRVKRWVLDEHDESHRR